MGTLQRSVRNATLVAFGMTALTPSNALAQDRDDRGGSGANIRQAPQEEPPKQAAPPIIELPKVVKDPGATYPEAALKEHLKETFRVVLIVELDAEGKVRKATPETAVGHGFDEAAVSAAENLEFTPAKRDGKPLPSKIKHTFTFAPPTSRIRGHVRRESDKPIAGAKITVTAAGGEPIAITANGEGDWATEAIPFGDYTITIEMPGYEREATTQALAPGEEIDLTQRLRLASAKPPSVLPGEEVEEINVKGQRAPREVTKRTLEQRELSRIPGTNGDALRAIQNLPGVARPPAIAGLLIIRGSAPQDTNVFIDGTLVPIVYHFGGLSSVIPTEFLDRIDFYPGNFSSQYGRVMGGVVDVALRDTKRDKVHGLVQFDLIDGRVLAEGPIAKTGWNFAVAGRRSWVDVWLKPVLESSGAGVTAAPVYYDYQAMVSRDWGKKTSFRLALFGSDDKLSLLTNSSIADPGISGTLSSHTGFWRAQARFKHKISDSTELRWTTAFGQDFLDFVIGTNYFQLTTYPLTSRFEIAQKVAKGINLNVGLDLLYSPYDVAVRLPPLPRPGEPPGGPFLSRPPRIARISDNQNRPAAYVELEIAKWKGGRVLPSVRVDFDQATKEWDVAPRIAVRQDITSLPRTTLKGGVGLFYQPPQPQETSVEFGQSGLVSNRAIHTSLGFEREFTKNVELSMEGFYKDLDKLVIPRDGNTGTGHTMGIETLLRYKPDDHFFGWVAYTLSRSVRRDLPNDDTERLTAFDQTHILTVLGSYRLGRGWEIGGRLRVVSGNRYTPSAYGFYDANSGVNLPLQQYPPSGERLPLFHQLDIRVDKTWRFPNWKLSAYLDLQNAYNQGNVEAISYNYNFTKSSYATGLPFLPSLGLRGEL